MPTYSDLLMRDRRHYTVLLKGISVFNPFYATGLFRFPLKTLENLNVNKEEVFWFLCDFENQ